MRPHLSVTPCSITRRGVLAVLAMLAALAILSRIPSSRLYARSDALCDRPAALVERRPRKAGDRGFREGHDRSVEPELRAAGRAHCDLRSGWHDLGLDIRCTRS